MATQIWVNIGLVGSVLPGGTKPLPEPNLLIITGVLWHSPKINPKGSANEFNS